MEIPDSPGLELAYHIKEDMLYKDLLIQYSISLIKNW